MSFPPSFCPEQLSSRAALVGTACRQSSVTILSAVHLEVNGRRSIRRSRRSLLPGSAATVTDVESWFRASRSGFTLIELLVVMAIIIALLALIVPALGPLKGSQDVTTSAYDLAGALRTARNYAIANNTYTWVGFFEQDFSSTKAPTAGSMPPYTGIGHLTIGVVYSRDGTKLVDDTDTSQDGKLLDATKLGQVDKLVQIYGVHLTALPAPPTASANTNDTLSGRPYQTDLEGAQGAQGTNLAQTLISSDTADSTTRPFAAQNYTFYKTVRFNPRGEANINSTLPCTRIIEFGLRPTHGNITDKNTPNVIAIQQAGVGGAVSIYRP